MKNLALRFAEVSLDLYCAEGTFEIEVPPAQDFDHTVSAYRDLGCGVREGKRARRIVVTCPRFGCASPA